MYRVLLAEDEPAARRYLAAIIEQRCPDFRLAAAAEDGQAALAAARKEKPDLVLTDIRMAGMDGLELAARLKEEFPLTPVVIVSGYQEFEYARKALNTGVVEYLLKPVTPEKLADALEALKPRLEAGRRRGEAERLQALVFPDGSSAPEAEADESFWLGFGKFSGAAPRRVPGVHAFSGKDETERVYLARRGETCFDQFVEALREDAGKAERPYLTLRVLSRPVAGRDLERETKELRREAELAAVPGETLFSAAPFPAAAPAEPDPLLRGKLEFALANARYAQVEDLVAGELARWARARTPALLAAAGLRELARLVVQRRPGGPGPDGAARTEYEVDALMAEARDWEDAERETRGLFRSLLRREEAMDEETPAVLQAVRRWVDAHFAEPLSVPSVCETFRISQTYLGKLFRRHEGKSFGEYLTQRRIEAAKRLMRESPGIPLKDVAQFVGYQDPFYFSRVFKAATGTPPSEYR